MSLTGLKNANARLHAYQKKDIELAKQRAGSQCIDRRLFIKGLAASGLAAALLLSDHRSFEQAQGFLAQPASSQLDVRRAGLTVCVKDATSSGFISDASVNLDGTFAGKTSSEGKQVIGGVYGRHELSITKEGYQTYVTTIDIGRGVELIAYLVPTTLALAVRWYGAAITDTLSEPFGVSTREQQFDLVAPGNTVRIYLNYWAWRNDPTGNTLGLPYRDFIDCLADWCSKRGLKVVWSAHVFSRWSKNWSFQAKENFLLTGRTVTPNADDVSENWTGKNEPTYTLSWSDYIQWVREIASRPKLRAVSAALDIFNEPPWIEDSINREIAEGNYLEFMRQAIDAVRAVAGDLPVIVEGIPEWNPGFFLKSGRSLGRANVIYALHWYCWNKDPYIDNRPESLIARAYREGRNAEGKQLMTQYFYDEGFFTLQDQGYPILFSEVGTDPYLQETYWSIWMQDFYDLTRERHVGFLQQGLAPRCSVIPDTQNPVPWLFDMLDSNQVSLNEIGRLWHADLQ